MLPGALGSLLDQMFCGILVDVDRTDRIDYKTLYSRFDPPITHQDCGRKCAPYNEYGVPFCCDTNHAIPTAYQAEWCYLQTNTGLWHLWDSCDRGETARLQADTPEGQVLIECQGHDHCQRGYRSITCRAFPFFPYITKLGAFIGLAYYWQYEDRCWVISNLDQVTPAYRAAFITAYDDIFVRYPLEIENFRYHSIVMRRVFGRRKRTISLLHRNGKNYKVSPGNGRLRRAEANFLPKFGPYAIASLMPFPEE